MKLKLGGLYILLWHVVHIETLLEHLPFMHILFCWGDEILGWGCKGEASMVRYNMLGFRLFL